jgi:cell wall integrity and stress response component
VALSAIAGGIFLFIRNKKRREVEEEYRRNAAVSSFIGGGKPPTSSGGDSAFTDSRLDPAVMAQRRMSDGSIADNQDYSRRILKVR